MKFKIKIIFGKLTGTNKILISGKKHVKGF